jgi:hypothetical protein
VREDATSQYMEDIIVFVDTTLDVRPWDDADYVGCLLSGALGARKTRLSLFGFWNRAATASYVVSCHRLS